MNVVSINVCIIDHISTNWTSVEPVGLSDMETGPCPLSPLQNKRLPHCLLRLPLRGRGTGGTSNSFITLTPSSLLYESRR